MARWQEYLTSIQKVPGSNPSWISDFSAEFFLSPITCINAGLYAKITKRYAASLTERRFIMSLELYLCLLELLFAAKCGIVMEAVSANM